MRAIMLMMMLVAALVASADERPFVTLEKLRAVTAGETQAEKVSHLEAHGMEGASSSAVLEKMETMKVELDQTVLDWHAALCAKQAYWESVDYETLAQEVERFEAAYDAVIAENVEELRTALSEADASRLDRVLAHGPKVTIIHPTAVESIRAGHVDINRYIGMRCQPENWKE